MRTTKIRINMKHDAEPITITAYHLGNGLYLHKKIIDGFPAQSNTWTLTAQCGSAIKHFKLLNATTKAALFSAAMQLTTLDWSLEEEKLRRNVAGRAAYMKALTEFSKALNLRQKNGKEDTT